MTDQSIAKTDRVEHARLERKFSLARRLLFQILARTTEGRLVINDEQGRHQFGSIDQRADLRAEVNVSNPEAYGRIIGNGVLGAGESYILGHWNSSDVVSVVRFFCANSAAMNAMDGSSTVKKLAGGIVQRFAAKNTLQGAKKNIVAHYDLSNDFFESFLDQSMMYSAAIFPQESSSLEDAAEYKLKHICERLQLTADDHLLEIGSGWGALSCYAARHYGCRVTTTTISDQQFERAERRIAEQGLQQQVELLNKDYRLLEGQYDKLVSVEMIEAVGHEYYSEYFSKCSSLLKQDGLMLLQAITIADQNYESAKNHVDFIKKYIFPGGCLPSATVIAQHLTDDTDMMLLGLEDIGQHYATTLAHWRARFEASTHRLPEFNFDERFKRMWEYYLMYCEGGFRERVISTIQVLAAKPACQQVPGVQVLGS